jgi:hypothetical protein
VQPVTNLYITNMVWDSGSRKFISATIRRSDVLHQLFRVRKRDQDNLINHRRTHERLALEGSRWPAYAIANFQLRELTLLEIHCDRLGEVIDCSKSQEIRFRQVSMSSLIMTEILSVSKDLEFPDRILPTM